MASLVASLYSNGVRTLPPPLGKASSERNKEVLFGATISVGLIAACVASVLFLFFSIAIAPSRFKLPLENYILEFDELFYGGEDGKLSATS